MSFNKVFVCGNLGRNPELRYTPQGNAVCQFSIATNKRDKNGADLTTWFRCTFWGKKAEVVNQHFAKGSPIFVEGELSIEEWTDRDGKNRFTLEINATDFKFVGNGLGVTGEQPEGNLNNSTLGKERERAFAAPSDDDIPFSLLFTLISLGLLAWQLLPVSA
jgi:single-strand DNA-binding protein